MTMQNQWVAQAIETLNRDGQRSSDTHLLKLNLPKTPGIDVYFKDESTHITGSLKHRLARSLFLYGLANGCIQQSTPIIEASSGSTAVSEAYFARMLGLRFIAVMAKSTSKKKIQRIEKFGGECVLVDNPSADRQTAQKLACELNGHFMDQFTYAERATDWRGNNNIAESIFQQMALEPHAEPRWIVCGAGTGGTSATIGRYIRYRGHQAKLCVVDPSNSVFYHYYQHLDPNYCCQGGSGIEGIGRPTVPASFIPGVVDEMMQVDNAQSLAAMRFLSDVLDRPVGASTGTNFCGVVQLIRQMQAAGKQGSIVTLICDSGQLYQDTYYNDQWLAEQGYQIQPYLEAFYSFYQTGQFPESIHLATTA